ncbi:growth-regulating factor 4-like isoform X1 [Olea europaea var. sylvestris]|uniref:growth-regulating factor 4-like isoform X1 n=1 Tax=Olea europaea var. sylvestris TaxID=158386 RepID=UPI000C1CE044|nr:growth-regulating factor 4-like isoform X1 [Olea europaea var. sylvestris]
MSGTGSTSVAVGMGGAGGELGYVRYRPPFTAVQWQELEHQAMIYKYLVAGLPVPPDLVIPIRHSLEALSARFFPHPSSGCCSYFGKKFDPEPGRCRRTDGKKWRCSKDAHPDSKYCERHMHRGRNRSRKPVENQSTSQSLSTAMTDITSGSSGNGGSYQTGGSVSFQNMPLYSASSEGLSFGSNVTKLQMEPVSHGINNKEYRYIHGLAPDADRNTLSPEAPGSMGGLKLGSGVGSGSWYLTTSQLPSSPSLKQKSDSQFLGHSSPQLHMPHAFVPIDTMMSKQHQQHCLFGSDIGSPGPAKQEQHSVHPFFSEWPTAKESWSNLDDNEPNKNTFSTTQLSISIPRASSEFSSGSGCSPNDA